MKKLKVDHKRYALFDYTEYMDRNGNSIPRPKKVKYDLGEVVFIIPQNSIGVVLGCIDHDCQELRTDMDGMQCFSDIRPAKKSDFKEGVRFSKTLEYELFGKTSDYKQVRYLHRPTNKRYVLNGAGGLIIEDGSTNSSLPLWLKDNSNDWKPC